MPVNEGGDELDMVDRRPVRDAAVAEARVELEMVAGSKGRRSGGPVSVEFVSVAPEQAEDANVVAVMPGADSDLVGGAAKAAPSDDGKPGQRRVPRAEMVVEDEKVAAEAGLQKVAFTARALDGPFHRGTRGRFELDYSSFRDSFGGDWAERLRVVVFSPCWLHAAERSKCPEPVALDGAVNDTDAGVILFEVDFAEVMQQLAGRGPGPAGRSWWSVGSTGGPGFGLSAGAYSSTGNFATTDLNPSGSWTVGTQAGNFAYSYPIEVPAPPNGPAPQVGLSYSSQAIDGLTADQNTQGGEMGPGWSMGEMFIERRFVSCSNDGSTALGGDLCYVDDNATVSMAGVTGELVFEKYLTPGQPGWEVRQLRADNAPGWIFKHFRRPDLTDTRGDYLEDNDLEHFQAVSPDGVAYWFGYGNRIGAYDPGSELNSVWTVPVRSLQAGEPCYDIVANSAKKWCNQAYRWNLDRIETASGQVANYRWHPVKNHYKFSIGTGVIYADYVAGGVLVGIDYGYTAAAASSAAGVKTHEVEFEYRYRCSANTLANCSTPPAYGNGASFPDIPNDMICAASTVCLATTPTFFDLHALHKVTALVRVANSTSMSAVGSWTLEYDWVWPDGTKRLWLRTITENAHRFGGTDLIGTTRFDGPSQGAMANRVDHNAAAGVVATKYWRVGRIRNDMGGLTKIAYTRPRACPQNPLGVTGFSFAQNTWSCFPRWYQPPGIACDPVLTGNSNDSCFSLWNKWVVDTVEEWDTTPSGMPANPNGNPPVITTYRYMLNVNNPGTTNGLDNGGMAWAADRDRYGPVRMRSWAQYRGFAEVRVTVGNPAAVSAVTTVNRYFRGMNGDPYSHDGSPPGHKSVTMVNSLPAASHLNGYRVVTDHYWLRGMLMETYVAKNDTTTPSQATDPEGVVYGYMRTRTHGSNLPPNWIVPNPQVNWVEPIREFHRSGGEYTRVDRSYDIEDRPSRVVEWGRVTSTYTNRVDVHGDGDDRCTQYRYTGARPFYPHGLVARVSLFVGATCTGTELSDEYRFYDGGVLGVGNRRHGSNSEPGPGDGCRS